MSVLIVRSDRVILPDGMRPAAVHVQDDRIVAIGPRTLAVRGAREIDAGALVVMPGIVDTHVHLNDPGRADWEGFTHGTKAAAAGGVTTIVDMPLNSVPPTTTLDGLVAKRRAADGRCHVDVGMWGGVVPGNQQELAALASGGVLGFKCFLCPSGVDEFPHVDERDLRMALPILARLGLPLLAHAELPSLLQPANGEPRRYRTWLESRPPAAEHEAIALLLRLSQEFGARVHIVHLASAGALRLVADAKSAGTRVSIETCPHYLTFAAEEVADGATALKCAPPIRERSHRDQLWQALIAGAIDFVATDHSPAPAGLKRIEDGDFLNAWGGISSLQLGLSIVWTGAATRGVALSALAQWLCEGPARLAGLDNQKGRLAPGLDADLLIWDPDTVVAVDPAKLQHRHPVTPYAGSRLRGQVRTTILRGETVFADGAIVGPARGQLLRRVI